MNREMRMLLDMVTEELTRAEETVDIALAHAASERNPRTWALSTLSLLAKTARCVHAMHADIERLQTEVATLKIEHARKGAPDGKESTSA